MLTFLCKETHWWLVKHAVVMLINFSFSNSKTQLCSFFPEHGHDTKTKRLLHALISPFKDQKDLSREMSILRSRKNSFDSFLSKI